MENIIGICGKFGSGKSTIAEYISEETNIEIFRFDKFIITQLLRFPYRRLAKKRLGLSPSLNFDHLLSNMRNLDRNLTSIEKKTILRWGNKEIKRLGRSGKPILIDFFGLPISKFFPAFGTKILITSDDEIRKGKLEMRNGFSKEEISRIDSLAADIVTYNKEEFDYIIENDYKSMPAEINQILALIRSKYSS